MSHVLQLKEHTRVLGRPQGCVVWLGSLLRLSKAEGVAQWPHPQGRLRRLCFPSPWPLSPWLARSAPLPPLDLKGPCDYISNRKDGCHRQWGDSGILCTWAAPLPITAVGG